MFSTVYPDMKSDNHNGAVNGKKHVSHIVSQAKEWEDGGVGTSDSLSPNEFVLEARSLREIASLSEVSVGGPTLCGC